MQRDVVLRAQQGDHEAFAVLAGAALTRLDTAARLILRDSDRAKDAVQNALVRAWRDLPQLRDPDRWEAWLHRLLVRSCYDELRRTRHRSMEVTMTSVELPAALDEAAATLRRADIERAFLALDPNQRLVVVLHYYLDLPLPQVAAAAGVPIGTAKSRLHRGLVALRESMAGGLGSAVPEKELVR